MTDNDNLPLIPGKRTICGDVKPVLREVFREMDQLPPLALDSSATDDEKLWIVKHNSECEEIWNQEGNLKKEFAKRISKKPQQNLYTLQKPTTEKEKEKRTQGMKMLRRKHLMPEIQNNAAVYTHVDVLDKARHVSDSSGILPRGARRPYENTIGGKGTGDQSLWVQNTLNRSSCDFSVADKPTAKLQQLPAAVLDDCSRQTYSVNLLKVPRLPPPPPPERPPLLPEYIYCVPHEVCFVNFTVGQCYTCQLRLVNVSKLEIRLSVSLPRCREIEVELSGSRGLRVTAGAATELKVLFNPKNTLTVLENLHIRTSVGKGLVVPIACYMEPPQLLIFVQSTETPIASMDSSFGTPAPSNIVDLGTKLLGDEHRVALTLHCNSEHASFFLLTEDAWIQWTIQEVTSMGFLKSGPFTIYPTWWAGGGVTRGTASCRASTTGFYKTDLKILSTNAVVRSLHVVADSVHFSPGHVSVEARQRDYDIMNDGDPECGSYVHLGTAFPNRSLSVTMQVTNQSPMTYSFYWMCRPWSISSSHDFQDGILLKHEEEEDGRNHHQRCSNNDEQRHNNNSVDSVNHICVDPEAGTIAERSAQAVQVRASDVGSSLGIHRAVIQLVLKDIPIESFPPGFAPKIVSTRIVEEVTPDGKVWMRTVCDILQAQVEVLWEVVPVRFFLDPPVLCLNHSRRVKGITVPFRATQLYGADDVVACWSASESIRTPTSLCLRYDQTVETALTVPLPALSNGSNDITLKLENKEWIAQCRITRSSATRHPSVSPTWRWLGVVPPGTKMVTSLEVDNHTHQDITWKATPYRWMGENPPNWSCSEAARTCLECHDHGCTCSILTPSQGALEHGQTATIHYNVYAPTVDCCVATLVKVARRPAPDAAVEALPDTEARATLIAYRVMAPRLFLRVLPCGGDKIEECATCDVDPGDSTQGSSVLRPSRALTVGSCSCYRLIISNATPVPTTVRWEPAIDGAEFLKVKFLPKSFVIGQHADIKMSVILEPRKVCGRRLFVLRAQVLHSPKPLYLVIDTAINGVEIDCEVPLGGAERNDSFVALRGIQKEVYPWDDATKPTTTAELFLAEDRKRAVVQENKCRCHFEIVYFPPVKQLVPPRGDDDPTPTPSPPEIVTSPPSVVRVCECFGKKGPIVPEHEEPCCLQFRDLPLRTVRSRRLTLRNVGHVTARWRMVVRRWPRIKDRASTVEALSTGKDRWAGDVRPPGVVIQSSPDKGICTAGQQMDILVQVYADCWGLYYDQLMLLVDNVNPIVIDVWIEVVGPPLLFASALRSSESDYDSTMWLSSSNPERKLRVKNTSRSAVTVHAITLLEHEHSQDAYPFRLFMRFTDVLLPICPCSSYASRESFGDDEETSVSSEVKRIGTGIELFLGEDCGIEKQEYYTMEPRECTVAAGAWMEWSVSLNPGVEGEPVPPGLVLLRTIPDDDRGDYWRRCEPPPARVGVRVSPRLPAMQVSCQEVRVKLCALELSYNKVARNVGAAPLTVRCVTAAPWQLVSNKPKSNCDCNCKHEPGESHYEVDIVLEPWSSTAICVEVSIDALEVWPVTEDDYDEVNKTCVQPSYPLVRQIAGQLMFYSEQSLLKTLPMTLVVNYPHLSKEPEAIDFGFVTHEDTRKTYITVWHSSLTANMDLVVSWRGNSDLRLYPRQICIGPRQRARIYVQYTAKWTGLPITVEGLVLISCSQAAWCRVALPVRANPARDAKFRLEPHDYTDQLLPCSLSP